MKLLTLMRVVISNLCICCLHVVLAIVAHFGGLRWLDPYSPGHLVRFLALLLAADLAVWLLAWRLTRPKPKKPQVIATFTSKDREEWERLYESIDEQFQRGLASEDQVKKDNQCPE